VTSAQSDVLELIMGDRLPVHRATTRAISGLWLQMEGGIIDPTTNAKVPGLPVGYAGRRRSGGIFVFDEFPFYNAGIISNTNKIVLGLVGHRKSSFVKCEISRGCQVGYRHLVTDLKGEYTRLAASIKGSRVLRFGANTDLYVNALDPTMDLHTQVELVTSLARSALMRDKDRLNVVELTLLWEAIRASHEAPSGEIALLTDTVRYLFEPSLSMVKAMHKTQEEVKAQGYDLALALQRYTAGDLMGMFHHPTTPGLLEESPLTVLNLEALTGDAAVAMIILLNFFTQSVWGRKNASVRFHKVYHDEAWDLARYPGFIDSVRRAFKLSGTWGVCNTLVAHHSTNLKRSSSNAGVDDLLPDTGTKILYAQDPGELSKAAEDLSLNESELERIPRFDPGFALWKLGNRPGIEVEHIVWPEERRLVETRHHIKGALADV
jgi:hypothetical protein